MIDDSGCLSPCIRPRFWPLPPEFANRTTGTFSMYGMTDPHAYLSHNPCATEKPIPKRNHQRELALRAERKWWNK